MAAAIRLVVVVLEVRRPAVAVTAAAIRLVAAMVAAPLPAVATMAAGRPRRRR